MDPTARSVWGSRAWGAGERPQKGEGPESRLGVKWEALSRRPLSGRQRRTPPSRPVPAGRGSCLISYSPVTYNL